MPEDVSGNKFPFDLERLRELIEMMEQHGLSEVSLSRGDEKWKLRRGGQQEFVQVSASLPVAPVAAAPIPNALVSFYFLFNFLKVNIPRIRLCINIDAFTIDDE